jgi:ADP-ribosyl-[dinitrogen reductase] hydrolase
LQAIPATINWRKFMSLLNIAVADAYGAGFEFLDLDEVKQKNKLTEYLPHNLDGNIAGKYTDDTQMSIAIAELLIAEDIWTKEIVAKYFLNAFKRDERKTYSSGFYELLKKSSSTEDMLRRISPDSVRNGSAMRSVPLGYIKDINELKQKAKIQSSVTHDTHEGIIASQTVALSAHYFIYNLGEKSELESFIFSHTSELYRSNKTSPTECDAIDTIDAVLTVLAKSSSLKDILFNSVDLGGDTDSVASIACGIASFSNEFKQDFPLFLYENIEGGKFGKDFLVDLDDKLKDKFNYINGQSPNTSDTH